MGYRVPEGSLAARPISAPESSSRGDASKVERTLSVGPVILGSSVLIESLHRGDLDLRKGSVARTRWNPRAHLRASLGPPRPRYGNPRGRGPQRSVYTYRCPLPLRRPGWDPPLRGDPWGPASRGPYASPSPATWGGGALGGPFGWGPGPARETPGCEITTRTL
jgi:hypothetical protein